LDHGSKSYQLVFIKSEKLGMVFYSLVSKALSVGSWEGLKKHLVFQFSIPERKSISFNKLKQKES